MEPRSEPQVLFKPCEQPFVDLFEIRGPVFSQRATHRADALLELSGGQDGVAVLAFEVAEDVGLGEGAVQIRFVSGGGLGRRGKLGPHGFGVALDGETKTPIGEDDRLAGHGVDLVKGVALEGFLIGLEGDDIDDFSGLGDDFQRCAGNSVVALAEEEFARGELAIRRGGGAVEFASDENVEGPVLRSGVFFFPRLVTYAARCSLGQGADKIDVAQAELLPLLTGIPHRDVGPPIADTVAILRGLVGDALDVLLEPSVKGWIEHVLVEMLALSLSTQRTGRAGETVGVVDVVELRTEFRDVAGGVEIQVTQVVPHLFKRLLPLRAEQSLPCSARVRQAQRKKTLSLWCDEHPAVIHLPDAKGTGGLALNRRYTAKAVADEFGLQ